MTKPERKESVYYYKVPETHAWWSMLPREPKLQIAQFDSNVREHLAEAHILINPVKAPDQIRLIQVNMRVMDMERKATAEEIAAFEQGKLMYQAQMLVERLQEE